MTRTNEWTPEQAQQAVELVEEADEKFSELLDTMRRLAGLMNDSNANAYFFNHLTALFEKDNRYDTDWQDVKERVTKRADRLGADDDDDDDDDEA